MKWKRDTRVKAGGSWGCRIKARESDVRYFSSIRGYISRRKWKLTQSRLLTENKLRRLNV
jgi:hypothetical protein